MSRVSDPGRFRYRLTSWNGQRWETRTIELPEPAKLKTGERQSRSEYERSEGCRKHSRTRDQLEAAGYPTEGSFLIEPLP